MAIPMHMHHKTIPMPHLIQTRRLNHHHHLLKETTQYTTQNSSLQSTLCHDRNPTTATRRKITQISNISEHSRRCQLVHHTHYYNMYMKSIHVSNISNLFEQCYISPHPIHVCMQQMIDIEYLTSLMLNK